MNKITKMLVGAALVAGIGVAAPATVAPVESASAASCTTQYMSYFSPYFYRVTLKPYGVYYFSTYQKALNFLTSGNKAGSIHKLVGTVTANRTCVDHWQWKKTVDNSVQV